MMEPWPLSQPPPTLPPARLAPGAAGRRKLRAALRAEVRKELRAALRAVVLGRSRAVLRVAEWGKLRVVGSGKLRKALRVGLRGVE